VLGPTHDRATRRGTLALGMCHPHDSHSGVLGRGHSPFRKSHGSDSSHATLFMSRFSGVLSILQSIVIGHFFLIATANPYQPA
jgi:hypothetical protein